MKARSAKSLCGHSARRPAISKAASTSAKSNCAVVISAVAEPVQPHVQTEQLPDCGPCVVVSSSCGDHEGRVPEKACPSSLSCSNCAAVLHELSNVMTGVLTKAQVLGWKLPAYSHLKRPVREMERGAQRGGELLRRLMQQFADEA